ncbi:hypothetical protein HYPGJ_21124 [Hyphomicrobium sp. GJ21]|nr:hypothetical protein HYPGJ_21124 [Hyphomicrobium sp. GJ21]
MPIERHFIGKSGLGDGIDPNGVEAVPVKKVARRNHDPLSGRQFRELRRAVHAQSVDLQCVHGPLTRMLPVGTYALPIGNKYHDSQFLVICFFGNAALGLREFTPCGDRYGAPSTKKTHLALRQ